MTVATQADASGTWVPCMTAHEAVTWLGQHAHLHQTAAQHSTAVMVCGTASPARWLSGGLNGLTCVRYASDDFKACSL